MILAKKFNKKLTNTYSIWYQKQSYQGYYVTLVLLLKKVTSHDQYTPSNTKELPMGEEKLVDIERDSDKESILVAKYAET